jgi:hypothetical protein
MVIDTAFYDHPMVSHRVFRTKKQTNSLHSLLTIHTLTTNPNRLCSQVEIHLCLESETIYAWEVAKCINKAISSNIKFVLIPYEGTASPFAIERKAFDRAAKSKTKIIISAGNHGVDLNKHDRFPQSYAKHYPNVRTISANDMSAASKGDWTVNDISGKIFALNRTFWGTSFSAPKYLNKILDKECRRINATSR